MKKVANNNSMKTRIYTIGYAHHTQESFLEQLLKYHINCVIDVRTMPYSAFHNQFNKEVIKGYLRQHGIYYIHMDESFGIIKDDDKLNTEEGYLDFEKLAKTENFINGIERVEVGLEKGYTIAFMCAEKDPINCHRSTLVARNFVRRGYDIQHILHDGTLETHVHMEQRMKEHYNKEDDQIHLFEQKLGERESLDRAYALCSKAIFIVNAKRVLKENYTFPKPPSNH